MTAAIDGHPATAARYRPVIFPARRTLVERREDGTIVLRSAAAPVPIDGQAFADCLPRWAERRGTALAICERDPQGAWRSIAWDELWRQVQAAAAGLLALGLGQDRPIMLLSGNSIEQAVLLLAAEHAGIPTAPVSPAYSTAAGDFARLEGLRDLMRPGAIFVQAAAPFARAVAALDCPDAPVIAVDGATAGQVAWRALVSTAPTPQRHAAVAEANRGIRPDHVARVLFTSGSTGVPKGVAMSYRNFGAVAAYLRDAFGALVEPQPVFLDWLPWHHGLGGVLNLGRSILLGATHYIDDGRPVPGLFERTVRNLREVSPSVFNSVPAAWAMLAPELERDPVLARSLFSRVANLGYGGASLSRDVWERIQRVAERTVGERIAFCSGLASTETTGMGTYCGWATDDVGNIGTPMPGSETKLVPLESGDGRYEIRMRGAHVFPGYLKRPDLTAQAFDGEGFFRLGDAVRLSDPDDPARGLRFAGRVAEDFKLASGTWVHTGAVRLALLERCSPLLTDAVICGHDRSYLAALAWPNVAACQALAPELAGLDAAALATHPRVVAELDGRLRAQSGTAASLRIERLLLLAEPPSLTANEIADKGYVNQAATRARRAHLVDELFAPNAAAHVARVR